MTFEKHRGFHGPAAAPFLAHLGATGWDAQGLDGVAQSAAGAKLVDLVRAAHEAGDPFKTAGAAIAAAKVKREIGLKAWAHLLKLGAIRELPGGKAFFAP